MLLKHLLVDLEESVMMSLIIFKKITVWKEKFQAWRNSFCTHESFQIIAFLCITPNTKSHILETFENHERSRRKLSVVLPPFERTVSETAFMLKPACRLKNTL